MAEVIQLETIRRQLAAKRGFHYWSRRFGEVFSENTRLQDLSSATLGKLIQAGEQTTQALNELIMGVQKYRLGKPAPQDGQCTKNGHHGHGHLPH